MPNENAVPAYNAAAIGTVVANDGGLNTLGAQANAAQTDPTATATIVSFIKGLLTGLGAKGDANQPDGTATASFIAYLKGLLVTLGLKADTAVTDATTTSSAVAFLKGLVKMGADAWDSTLHAFGVKLVAPSSGGASLFFTADASTKREIKATAGQVFGSLHLENTVGAVTYVDFFNLPAAGVTVGTTVPVLSIYLAANEKREVSLAEIGVALGGTGITVYSATAAGGATGAAAKVGLAFK